MVELYINGYHLLVLCEVFVDIFPFLCASFYYSFQVLGVFFVGFGGWLGWDFVYFIEVGRPILHVFPHIIREI